MSNLASIPFMIPNRVETRLRTLGHTQQEINPMTPSQAWENFAACDASELAPNPALDFTLDDITELNLDPVNDTDKFLSILHPAGYHRFTQDMAAPWPKAYWSRTDEFLRMPPTTGKEQIYVSINPICQRITDADRAKRKFNGKSDSWIEQRIASKNRTVAALTALIRDYDAKDFTDPSQAEIIAQYELLRANPDKAKSTDNALLNEAVGAAKSAKYKTNPAHYKALALAHVEAVTPAPSIVVASGGGYNCYWLLDEPFQIRTDEHDYSHHVTSYAADVQKRWVHMDARADQGVNDIRRIFRPVGTKNHKAAYAPNFPVVSFVTANFDLRYSLAELVALLPAVNPEAPAVTPRKTASTGQATEAATEPQEAHEGNSVIHAYNAKHKIKQALLDAGYTEHGDRMMRPGGDGQPGVELDLSDNKSRHWSSNDALCDPHWRRPFDVFCTYTHKGNLKKAVYAAAVELGMVKNTDVTPIVDHLRLWIRTNSFAAHVPPSPDGIYRTDATDTKVADAVCDAMLEDNRLEITIGKKRLGKLAGVSPNTAMKALGRLNGWLFTVTPDKFGTRVALVEKCRLHQIDPVFRCSSSLTTGGQSSENDKMTGVLNEYSPRKADDPFLTGTSRHVRSQIKEVAATLNDSPEGDCTPVVSLKYVRKHYTVASFGEGGLRVLDALNRAGDMTAHELAEETGKKVSAIRTACARLVKRGLLESTREGSRGQKVYGLADDAWARLEMVAPLLRTYKLSAQRENKRLESAQQWTKVEIAKAEAAGDKEQAVKLERRFAKQAKTRIAHLESLYSDLPAKEIERLAYEVAAYKRSPEKEAVVRSARRMALEDHELTVVRIVQCLTSYAGGYGTLPAMPTRPTDEEKARGETTITIEGQTFERAIVADVMRNPALVKRTLQGVEEVYAEAKVSA